MSLWRLGTRYNQSFSEGSENPFMATRKKSATRKKVVAQKKSAARQKVTAVKSRERTFLFGLRCPQDHLIIGVTVLSKGLPVKPMLLEAAEILHRELKRRIALEHRARGRCGICGAEQTTWISTLFQFTSEKQAQEFIHSQEDGCVIGELFTCSSPDSKPRQAKSSRRKAGNLRLKICMVPQPLFGRNLRSVLTELAWKRLRRQKLAEAEGKCQICGAIVKEERNLHIHEEWSYDERSRVATLTGLRVICQRCHACVHFDLTVTLARQGKIDPQQVQKVIDHFCSVNEVDISVFTEHRHHAQSEWTRRSKCNNWSIDLGRFTPAVGKD
jgi:hypothetical protein